MLIEAHNLYRYYGKHCAVKDVSINVAKGQIVGFLGPNGAGKTTTMQMLCGNLAPSSGEIKINGFNLLTQPKAAKQFLGYLPDTPPLYKDLTVLEFLNYCARLHGIRNQVEKAVRIAIDRTGLGSVANRLIGNLSKGFQQRTGIAQAILHNPEAIVLDEPTVGLDPRQIKEIRMLIRELGQEHGVILSTHILNEVQESCTHVQIINQGQLVLAESIAELNTRMGTSALQIVTRLPPDIQKLTAIPGIISIESLGETTLKIHYQATSNPNRQLTETIIEAGWELLELTPIKKSVEDIFIHLTQDNDV